eukprot:scaffold776_cov347-Pavlova_lutheri.AAC.33
MDIAHVTMKARRHRNVKIPNTVPAAESFNMGSSSAMLARGCETYTNASNTWNQSRGTIAAASRPSYLCCATNSLRIALLA